MKAFLVQVILDRDLNTDCIVVQANSKEEAWNWVMENRDKCERPQDWKHMPSFDENGGDFLIREVPFASIITVLKYDMYYTALTGSYHTSSGNFRGQGKTPQEAVWSLQSAMEARRS